MARIRSVKPEFWTDEKIVDLSPVAKLLYIGIWNFADDHGLLVDDPRRLKLQVLPADDIDAQELVNELVSVGLLTRVRSETGVDLLWVRSFAEHQKIDKRAAGKWGNPLEWTHDYTRSVDIPAESPPIPPNPPESPRPLPKSAESRPRKGKERKGSNPPKPPQGGDDELEAYGLGPPRDSPLAEFHRKAGVA